MKKHRLLFGLFLLAWAAAVCICMTVGTYSISISDIIAIFAGGGTDIQRMTVLQIRLPRIAIAVVVGTALSVSGSILQSLTKNDLAEPGIMGINAGASLAVVLVISAGGSVYYNALSSLKMYLIPFAALTGALAAATAIFLLSRKEKKLSRAALVLIGIGVNAGLNAIITFYQLRMSKGDYNQALTWISGSLWGSSWEFFYLTAPAVFMMLIYVFYRCRTLDIMDLDEGLSIGLGIRVERERKIFFAVAVAMAALATAVAGNLMFVGLIGPHIAKALAGPSYRRHIPLAALISSTLVIVADTICKNAFSPLEIPAGIMISMIGVPYFIFLMKRSA